ncbi:MAG TPA: hypothetical protein VGG39_23350 [Polyangiaceae bacterium]
MNGYDPISAPKAGTYRIPAAPEDTSNAAVPETEDRARREVPAFVLPEPPDAVKADLATVTPEDRLRLAQNYDSDVATQWAKYQGDTLGLPPEMRSALPPNYQRQATRVSTPGPDLVEAVHNAVAPAELKPDSPVANPRDAAREPTGSFVFGREANEALDRGAPPAPKKSAPAPRGVGGGGPRVDPWGKRLEGDFNERIAAMQDEMAARQAMASGQAEGLGNAAELQRGNAMASAAEAHDNAEAMRARIAEVDQLNRDYAEGTIDTDKWWGDRTIPQKIGAAIGLMAAGWAGGPAAALNQLHAYMDGSLMQQKEAIDRKYKAGQMADNLLGSFMRTSTNEQEAMDKARAAMYGAAMVEVARSGAAAKGDVEAAQVRQLIADMKSARDAALAKLAGQRAGNPTSASGLEVDPNMVVGVKGQQYIVPKGDAENMRQTMNAYERLEDSIREGLGLLDSRGITDYHPWSANIKRGEGIDATVQESLAKLSSARGVPVNIQQIAKEALPQFGSLTAAIDKPKAERFLSQLDRYRQETLSTANAQPVDVRVGPGVGKQANELKYWATPSTGKPTTRNPAPPPDNFGAEPVR